MNNTIWTNVGKMMERRGFTPVSAPELTQTVSKFPNVYMQKFERRKTFVWCMPDEKRNLAELSTEKVDQIIIEKEKFVDSNFEGQALIEFMFEHEAKTLIKRGFNPVSKPEASQTMPDVYMQSFFKDHTTQVWHTKDEKANKDFIRFLAEKYSCADHIIVQKEKMGSVSHGDCANITGNVFIQHIFEHDLMFDLLAACHDYEFQVMEELPPLLKKNRHKLPPLLAKDKFVQYFGWKKGSIIFVRVPGEDEHSRYYVVKGEPK